MSNFNFQSFVSIVAEAFATALKEDMDANGAKNYAAFKMSTSDGTDYLALFTRMDGGKTPMEMHAEALVEVERLREVLRPFALHGMALSQHLAKDRGFLEPISQCAASALCWGAFTAAMEAVSLPNEPTNNDPSGQEE